MKFKIHFLFAVIAMAQGLIAHAEEPHIEFSAYSEIDWSGFSMKLMMGKKVMWRKIASSPYATIIPQKRAILYTEVNPQWVNSGRRVTLRTYEGKELWSSSDSLPEFGDYSHFSIGGDSALAACEGPTFPAKSPDDLSEFSAELHELPVQLLSLKNGKILWKSNQSKVGSPIWNNGQVFLSLKWSESPRDARRFEKHGVPVPVWIREWTIKDKKCLWKHQLRGMPSGNLRVIPLAPGRARVIFTGGEDSYMTFLKSLKRLDITVPILRGTVITPALETRFFSRSWN